MNEELMARLALDSILGGNGNNESNEDEVFCTSIKEAIICFKSHMYPNGARYRRELVDFICEESNNVYGAADEFHNLIMDVFETGDYFSGIKLCQYALRTYPYNCDILAMLSKQLRMVDDLIWLRGSILLLQLWIGAFGILDFSFIVLITIRLVLNQILRIVLQSKEPSN